jgi:uncharacterized protein (DUF2384 family)
MVATEVKLLEKIPQKPSSDEILSFIQTNEISGKYFQLIKNFTRLNDNDISALMQINIKTFRNKSKETVPLRSSLLSEHLITLLSLFKHGKEVFGTIDKFNEWLNKKNFMFGKKPPIEYLNTISGIKLVDDRLTGMEYGDNA